MAWTTYPYPGDTLRELLDEQGWFYNDFAACIGYSPKHLNQVLHGRSRITAEFAVALEQVLGNPPARFWLNLQLGYDLWRVDGRLPWE